MSSVEDASYDAVYSSHNIEHVYPYEVNIALKEMYRVLNDTGFVVITCPDLQEVSKFIADDKFTEPFMNLQQVLFLQLILFTAIEGP